MYITSWGYVTSLNHHALCQAMHGAPLYIAETSPSRIRGTLISLKELFIVLGILVYLSSNCYTLLSIPIYPLLTTPSVPSPKKKKLLGLNLDIAYVQIQDPEVGFLLGRRVYLTS